MMIHLPYKLQFANISVGMMNEFSRTNWDKKN